MKNQLDKIRKILKNKITINDNLSLYNLILIYRGEKCKHKIFTSVEKEALLELIKIKQEENKREAEEWIKSGLFVLACERTIKEKKGQKIILNEQSWEYDINVSEIIANMTKILNKTTERRESKKSALLTDLRAYCEKR